MDIVPFVNKRVTFRFSRLELFFDLSQSLFSSFDVDTGTRALLKTITRHVDLPSVKSVLDVGCGMGVIGISLKKVNAGIALTVQDRDALALAFTRHNAQLNRVGGIDAPGGLALQGLNGRQFNLIVSNLPGKAGQPVLEDMLARIPHFLTESGMAAVVIVKPLAEMVARTLGRMGSDILVREARQGYEVFHFRGGQGEETAVSLAPYIRKSQQFKPPDVSYQLQTAYNLPEFDTLGYQTVLAMEMMKQERVHGRVLIWNPGQGHLPVYLHKRFQPGIDEYILGSRDLLSLNMAKINLQEQGVPAAKIETLHQPSILGLTGPFDFILMFPDLDPGVPWHKRLPHQLFNLLPLNGHFLLVAKSTFVQRFLPNCSQMTLRKDKKRRGYRAVLIQKPGFAGKPDFSPDPNEKNEKSALRYSGR